MKENILSMGPTSRFNFLNCFILPLLVAILMFCLGCKKIVDIGPPISSITTEQVFADSANAAGGINGLYLSLRNSRIKSFSSGLDTWMASMMADEMNVFDQSGTTSVFFTNELLSNTADCSTYWQRGYSIIYQANACIEALARSTGILPRVKEQFLGEAKFVRAWCYFYLVNFFGDVPYVATTDWKAESIKPRASVDFVYDRILEDLEYSFAHLSESYNTPGKEHTRANKWTASALLARVYLYRQNWNKAEEYATTVIDQNSLYQLEPLLEDVFLRTSKEQILQLSLDTRVTPGNATNFYLFLPAFDVPNTFLTEPLLKDFEKDDQRRISWVDSIQSLGTTYYYPSKFKIGLPQASIGAPATEYYTMLRLSEMYLIRAEARANMDNLKGALMDANIIRERSGLDDLAGLEKAAILNAILHERRIEFFVEWGHRWFDLKRTGRADAVLSKLKPKWKPTAKLMPIPFSEMRVNAFLTQNPGY